MNTTGNTNNTQRNSHSISKFLDPIQWIVFGNANFPRSESHHKFKQGSRIRHFSGLMLSLAQFCKIKPKKLVYFQNNEFKPQSSFYHVHFLLGRANLDGCSPESICEFLDRKSKDYGFGQCDFKPFDQYRDGVGYDTKKVYTNLINKTPEVIPIDYYPSKGLVKLWNEKGTK